MSSDHRKPRVFPAVLAFLAFVLSWYMLHSYFSNTLGRITLQGKFPAGTQLMVESRNKFGSKRSHTIDLGGQPLNVVKRVGSGRINAPARGLSLIFMVPKQEVEAGNNVINIYNLQLEQPFSGLTAISKESLSKVFQSTGFFGRDSAFLKVSDETGKVTMAFRGQLPKAPIAWPLVPALFLALLVWLLSRSHRFAELPAIRDMSLGRNISSDHEFNTINGIRGIAALLVLFSHAAPGFKAVNVGIALLFVISGFLLSKPFVLDPRKVFNWGNIESYLLKRVKRILPMYYVFIFISFMLTREFDTAARNFLFVEGSGHLWPMTQIFTFYMFLPLVLMLSSMLWRLHRILPVIVLVAIGLLWLFLMTDWKPFYNGRYFKEFYLHAFLLGVAGAYIQFDLVAKLNVRDYRQPLAIILFVVTVLTVAWSAPVNPPAWIHPFIRDFYGKCLLSLLIIILALQIRETWVNPLIANPLFKSIGVVGFSFYLLHGLGMELALELQSAVFGMVSPSDRSWSLVVIAFILTYFMSLFTYSYIERPFFGYRENRR